MLEHVVHARDDRQLGARARTVQPVGLHHIHLDVGIALHDQHRHRQGSDVLRRHILEPRDQVRLDARPEQRGQRRRHRIDDHAAFQRSQNAFAFLFQVGRQLALELLAQQRRGAVGDAGNRHIGRSASLLRRQHPDQRTFAVPDHRHRCKARIRFEPGDPRRRIVHEGIEPQRRFGRPRCGARADAALVVAHRRDASVGQASRQELEAVVAAGDHRAVAVTVGGAGAGDDERHARLRNARRQLQGAHQLAAGRFERDGRLGCLRMGCDSDGDEQQRTAQAVGDGDGHGGFLGGGNGERYHLWRRKRRTDAIFAASRTPNIRRPAERL